MYKNRPIVGLIVKYKSYLNDFWCSDLTLYSHNNLE